MIDCLLLVGTTVPLIDESFPTGYDCSPWVLMEAFDWSRRSDPLDRASLIRFEFLLPSQVEGLKPKLFPCNSLNLIITWQMIIDKCR